MDKIAELKEQIALLNVVVALLLGLLKRNGCITSFDNALIVDTLKSRDIHAVIEYRVIENFLRILSSGAIFIDDASHTKP